MTIPQNIQQLSQKLILALKTISKLSITVTGNHINYTQTEVVTNLAPNSRKYHPYKKNTRSYSGIHLPELLKLALRENLMFTPISILPNPTDEIPVEELTFTANALNKLYHYPYDAEMIFDLAIALINGATQEDVCQMKEAEYIEYTMELAGFDYEDEIETYYQIASHTYLTKEAQIQ
ncbi:hypothetical protein G9A89_017073 [Geosiphon pyriformis]|nr:hypothetical protein G9A89_017073 [Geosiphon pyriformis]